LTIYLFKILTSETYGGTVILNNIDLKHESSASLNESAFVCDTTEIQEEKNMLQLKKQHLKEFY